MKARLRTDVHLDGPKQYFSEHECTVPLDDFMTAKQIPARTSSSLPAPRQRNVPSIKISLAQLDVSDSLKPVISEWTKG